MSFSNRVSVYKTCGGVTVMIVVVFLIAIFLHFVHLPLLFNPPLFSTGYSCAWQKEILVQGRLYITAHHFCFYSSILGFETKVTYIHTVSHTLVSHLSHF